MHNRTRSNINHDHAHLRSDVLDLNAIETETTLPDDESATRVLIAAGFRERQPQPGHWILSRGPQQIHLYSQTELTIFASRYAHLA